MRGASVLAATAILLGICSLAQAAPPEEPVEAILCRGTSAEGFSYWWGGECWCANGCTPDLANCEAGDCEGVCENCTHTGPYGADCSGFVSKAWQVPDPYPVEQCGTERYVAESFTYDHDYWDPVSIDELQPGDAVATSSHVILIIGPKDQYGEHEVVEAMGCSYGIVRHMREIGSSFHGARRINLVACGCTEGQRETQSCGDCGSQDRTCEDGCRWSDWSPCEGADPTEETACTLEGATGACAEGVRKCVAGWLSCEPKMASTETCDGIDNDCDDVVDNGTPESLGEGYPCTNACGEGQSQCVDGAIRCVSPGTTWPDPTCNPDGGGGGGGIAADEPGGGCSCATVGGASSSPVACAPLLLVLLAGRGRRRRELRG